MSNELRKKWMLRKPQTPDDIVECLSVFSGLREITREVPISLYEARQLYLKAVEIGLMSPLKQGARSLKEKASAVELIRGGKQRAIKARSMGLPAPGKVKVYFLSSCQNDTAVLHPLLENVQAYLAFLRRQSRVESAELHISRFTYVKKGLGDQGNKDYVTQDGKQIHRRPGWRTLVYPPELMDFYSDERLELAPGLLWCGEVNILPTAERPLTGFESYTGRSSGIFPHTKVAMDSIASMLGEATKFNYTTGAITVRNYITKKAGLKADFHHCYGGLLVEVDSDGNWWCRQIVSEGDGTFYDLGVKVKDGHVERGDFVEAVVWGDVHTHMLDPDIRKLCWGKGGLLDRWKPKHQFFHDVLDFHSRSHHEMKDPMRMYKRHVEKAGDVGQEIKNVRDFLLEAHRDWCESVVVNSNHDRHLGRWLNSEDARFDSQNVEFWAKMWVACLDVIKSGGLPNFLETALRLVGYDGDAALLLQDESYVVCEDEAGGIECGLHGDAGPNGSRGSPRTFAKMGRKLVTAHSHSAGISDGVYTVGTCSSLRPDYVSGPSSWSHTNCLIYENGKRQLITIWAGKERA